MSLTNKDIENVANLAKLKITDQEEMENLKTKLNDLFGIFDELQSADTSNISPMAHPIDGMYQKERSDEITESVNREDLQKTAPETEAGLYLVPTVIE